MLLGKIPKAAKLHVAVLYHMDDEEAEGYTDPPRQREGNLFHREFAV